MIEQAYGLIGVDYGAKLAGTTVIAELHKGQALATISLRQSNKNEDADDMLQGYISSALLRQAPLLIFFDAPLSLPGVYTQPQNYTDYFYRAGDKLLHAMSPMFLGGLTARAMRLKALFNQEQVRFFETYPAAQAKRLALKALDYKGDKAAIPAVWAAIQSAPEWQGIDTVAVTPQNWHQVDALLALLGALRYVHQTHTCVGDEAEGAIYY